MYIAEFLNTSEPIWTYNSTATTSPVCKVDVIQECTWANVRLRRLYIQNRITHRDNLSGIIPTGQPDTMYISPQDNSCQQERLIYMAYNRTCAVVSVNLNCPNSMGYVELRVRNSSVSTGPECGCVNKFDEYRSRGHQVYTPDCQRILQPGCQTSPCYGG
ncbi:uncharacterized protein [Dermacentor albipictus]|uniref:uncharacterized protein n=1 Tax=Dermacentor albipictus TaxID=60249 RepID=UPI0038FD32C3